MFCAAAALAASSVRLGVLACAVRLPRCLAAPLTPPILWAAGPPKELGGVAQLGERLLCKQEVIGSIPFTSTTAQCASRIVAGRVRRNASCAGSGAVQKRATSDDRVKQCLLRAFWLEAFCSLTGEEGVTER